MWLITLSNGNGNDQANGDQSEKEEAEETKEHMDDSVNVYIGCSSWKFCRPNPTHQPTKN